MSYPESESGCPYETIGKLKDEIDRLRAENERLTAIIANVCLALGYEESAWPAHWETLPDHPKETEG